jgi:hypothetical protein
MQEKGQEAPEVRDAMMLKTTTPRNDIQPRRLLSTFLGWVPDNDRYKRLETRVRFPAQNKYWPLMR